MQGGYFVLPMGGRCACLVLPLQVAVTSDERLGVYPPGPGTTCARWRSLISVVPCSGCSWRLSSGSATTSRRPYLALSLALPVVWIAALWLAGAYDVRFIGTGSDEYRKVLNAGVSLTAAVAIFSYAINLELSRGYVVIALPSVTLFDLVARHAMRKRLHKKRASGRCMHSVVAVGHELAVADLVTELKRERLPRADGGRRLRGAARRAR